MCVTAMRSAKDGCTGSAGSRHTGHTCSLLVSSHVLMQFSVCAGGVRLRKEKRCEVGRRGDGRPQKAWPQTVSHALARVPVQMGHVSAARVSASMPCTAVLYVVIVHTQSHTRSHTRNEV